MKKILECFVFAGLLCLAQWSDCFAQGTAFTYQGRLNNDGAPASGTYDLQFTLFAADAGGPAVAGPVTNTATGVTNGLFLTTIDFGANIFTGSNYWLEVAVQTNGGSGFFTLSPRQPIAHVPYAIFANTASNVIGVISSAQLPPGVITNGAASINIANISGTFSGNGGAGLTNVNSLNGATNRGSLLITTDSTHATGDLNLIPEGNGGIFMSGDGGSTWPYGIFLQQTNDKMVFASPGQISITPTGPIQLGGQAVGNESFYVYMQRNGSANAEANASSYPFYFYTDCFTESGNTIGVMEMIAENPAPGASSATNTVLSFYGQNGNSFSTPNLAFQVLYDGARFPGRTIYDLTPATPGSVYMINFHDKSRQVYAITTNVTFGFTNYASLANQDCHMQISLYPVFTNFSLTFPTNGSNFNVLWEGGQPLTNITATNAVFLNVDLEIAFSTNIILSYATAPYHPVMDASVNAFVLASGLANAKEISNLNTLVAGLKNAGLWTKADCIYPMRGGTSSIESYNLVNPALYRIQWSSAGLTFDNNGVTSTGAGGVGGDTGFQPSIAVSPHYVLGACSIGGYTHSLGQSGGSLVSSFGNGTARSAIRATDTAGEWVLDGLNLPTANNVIISGAGSGFFLANQTSTTIERLFAGSENLSQQASTSAVTNVASNPFGILSRYDGSVFDQNLAANCSFIWIGGALTPTDVSNLYNLVTAYETAEGIQ